jgi:hypothetical protein
MFSGMTKIYQWFSYSRWLAAVVVPFAFFFSEKQIILAVFTLLSLLAFVLAIVSNKDRKGIPGILILVSELSAFLWILATFLLAVDSDLDYDFFGSFLTVIFIYIQYIFWILNHIAEFVLAIFCLLPIPEIENDMIAHKSSNKMKMVSSSEDKNSKKSSKEASELAAKKAKEAEKKALNKAENVSETTKKSMIPLDTGKPFEKVAVDETDNMTNDFSFSILESENELNNQI